MENSDKTSGELNKCILSPDVQIAAEALQKVLDWLSVIDDITTTKYEMPKDVNFIKTFRKRKSSIVMIMRPSVISNKTGRALKCKYTGDDFIIIEYDKIVNDLVQVIPAALDHQLRTLVDSNNGLLIIED